MSEIARFLEAQKDEYDIALKEIKKGRKESCWIWYIFPQIQGLGTSSFNEKYAIKDIEEAKEYLENETLKSRLIEITQALLDLEENDIKNIMGFPDNLKLKSSMTLFKKVEEIYNIDCGCVFQKTLDKFFNGEEDNRTITILEKQKFEKEMKRNKEKDNEENINNEIYTEIKTDAELNKDNEEKPNQEFVKEEIKEDSMNKEDIINFEQNQKVEEMVIEKENDDDMMIIQEDIDESNQERIKNKEQNNGTFKDEREEKNKDEFEIYEEKNDNDMLIKEENVNLNNQEGSSNNLSNMNNDTNLNKRKSIHFSLPSRSQMKNMDNNGNKKSEIEIVIDNKTLQKTETVVIYPYDETSEKKCCPDCCIF